MRESEADGRPAAQRRRRLLAGSGIPLCVAVLVAAGCGGGERQDEKERSATYEVEVTDASFPRAQKLAKESTLELVVRNADTRTVPNVAVTLRGLGARETAEGEQGGDGGALADPERPYFVINGEPTEFGGVRDSREAIPKGSQTAYVDTYATGRLRPGKSKTLRWSVTAVRAGRYDITYRVAAGLHGKAKAVTPAGGPVRGSFTGTISAAAPDARVGSDGKTIVRE